MSEVWDSIVTNGQIGSYAGITINRAVDPIDYTTFSFDGNVIDQFSASTTGIFSEEEERVAQERGLLLMTLRSELDSEDYEPRRVVQMMPTAPGVTWRVGLDTRLEDHVAFVHPQRHFVLISNVTWDTLSADLVAMRNVLDTLTKGASGLKFLSVGDGPYGKCVKSAGATTGVGRVVAKDRITALEELAEALAVQAQDLNAQGGPSNLQQQNFAVRLAELNAHYRELEVRLCRLRGLLDITGESVLF